MEPQIRNQMEQKRNRNKYVKKETDEHMISLVI